MRCVLTQSFLCFLAISVDTLVTHNSLNDFHCQLDSEVIVIDAN